MEYFYAYLPEKKDKDSIMGVLDFPENQVFIDEDEEDIMWQNLLNKLKDSDSIVIPSINQISSEEITLKEKLLTLQELHAQLLTLDEEDLDISLLLQLMEFIEMSRRKRAKKLQREGIEKALKKKYKGQGQFGRPRVKIPDDFEENVKRIIRKEMSHDTYRAQLGMKRSTYYKLVKEVRESWIKKSE